MNNIQRLIYFTQNSLYIIYTYIYRIGMMESLTRELKLMKSDVITTTVCPYFISNCSDRSGKRILRLNREYINIDTYHGM